MMHGQKNIKLNFYLPTDACSDDGDWDW